MSKSDTTEMLPTEEDAKSMVEATGREAVRDHSLARASTTMPDEDRNTREPAPEAAEDEASIANEVGRARDASRVSDKGSESASLEGEELLPSEKPDSKSVATASLETASELVGIQPKINWARVVAVKSGVWQVRLLGEMILPTQPMRAGTDTTLEAMKARLVAEQKARLPVAFSSVQGRQGYVLESAVEGLRWRSSSPSESLRMQTTNGRAEVSWAEGARGPHGMHELLDARGQVLAQVRLEADGSAVLSLAEGMRGSLWFGLDGDVARFTGQRLGEISMPVGWRWTIDGRGARLEIPLTTPAGTSAVETVALFDAATGWALVKAVRLRGSEER